MGTMVSATGDAAADATEQRKTSAGRTRVQTMTPGAINVVMREGGGTATGGAGRRGAKTASGVESSVNVVRVTGVTTRGGTVTPTLPVSPSPTKKQRAVSLRTAALREVLEHAGAKAVPMPPSSLRPLPLQHKHVKVRGQVELTSPKPTTEFSQLIRNFLVELQKR